MFSNNKVEKYVLLEPGCPILYVSILSNNIAILKKIKIGDMLREGYKIEDNNLLTLSNSQCNTGY